MSEFEREELTSRTKGMSEDEMKLVASILPSEVLVNELAARLISHEQKISRAAHLLG